MNKLNSISLLAVALAIAVPPVARAEEKAAADRPARVRTSVKAKDAKAANRKVAPGAAQAPAPAESKSYYVPTRAYRLEPYPEVPAYVRNAGKLFNDPLKLDWLNIGIDSRTRFEYRENDYRPWTQTTVNPPASQRKVFANSPILLRTRVYVGVQDILDPFRFAVEMQDSRVFNSIYQYQGQEVNQTDLISAYGELYFKDAFGKDARGNDRPLTVRAGRQHFEILDRRLIAENEFRNTTNTFDGFRLKIGKKENDWDLDSFVMRPVNRDPVGFDRPDWRNWIFGSVFSFRRFSEYATIQPYFIGRHQFADQLDPSNSNKISRQTQAPGVRIYGNYANFDYDFDLMKQFGMTGEFANVGAAQVQRTVQQDAIAYAIEGGYTFASHPWKPRVSANYAYGSGNKSPFDSSNQNVDTFYGFNQPFSRNDYISWNNIKAPKVRLEFSPTKELQVDTAFSAYWLASTAAAWDRINLIAPLGNRSDFVGTEFDIRFRYKLSQYLNLTASYARFWPGSFVKSFAPFAALQQFPTTYTGQTASTLGLTARPTDFFYIEVSGNPFGDGQPLTPSPLATAAGVLSAPPILASKDKAPSWTDYYVGLKGGGAWSSPHSVVDAIGAGAAAATGPIATTSRMADGSNQLNGFVGAFNVGANYKLGNYLVPGVEADIYAVSGNTDGRWQGSIVTAGGNTYFNTVQRTSTLNYLGTIRGRLGVLATPTVEVYGTGGFAFGGVTSNTAVVTERLNAAGLTQANPWSQNTLLGWAAGGGVEWAFLPKWTVKAEYLHYDLGAANSLGFAAQPAGLYQFAVANRTTFAGNLVTGGVNRHFDLFEEPAVTVVAKH